MGQFYVAALKLWDLVKKAQNFTLGPFSFADRLLWILTVHFESNDKNLYTVYNIPHFVLYLIYNTSNTSKSKFWSIFCIWTNNFQFFECTPEFPVKIFVQMSKIWNSHFRLQLLEFDAKLLLLESQDYTKPEKIPVNKNINSNL